MALALSMALSIEAMTLESWDNGTFALSAVNDFPVPFRRTLTLALLCQDNDFLNILLVPICVAGVWRI
jgi:hypothetical protein